MRTPLLAMLVLLLASITTVANAKPPSARPCPRTDTLLTHLPTNLADISGIVPLGNLNPATHTVPSRHLYFYPTMTTPGDPTTAITVKLFSPGKVEIVAIEKQGGIDWSLHMKVCKDVSLYYFHVDALAPAIEAAMGDILVGSIALPGGGRAKPVSIPLTPGAFVGTANTFDVGVQDFRKPPLPFANQARYKVDIPVLLASIGLAGDAIATTVVPRIVPQALQNRCPIDYFTPPLRAAMTAKLADFDGAPLASGIPKCHSHEQDVPKTAQGNWWNDVDPVHDALFAEEHALALVNWNVTPSVELFSLNENVPGLTSALLEGAPPADYVNSAYEFPVRAGPQRTNRRFAEITDDALYCYDLVRIHRGGPRLLAVILLQVTTGPSGPRTKLNIEFVKASRCPALPVPWTFGPGVASYYR